MSSATTLITDGFPAINQAVCVHGESLFSHHPGDPGMVLVAVSVMVEKAVCGGPLPQADQASAFL